MPTSAQSAEIQRISSALKRAEAAQDAAGQLQLYQKLCRLVPNVPLIHAQIAHFLLAEGHTEEARPHVVFALSQPPDLAVDALLFQHLCKSTAYTCDLEQARSWFELKPNLWRFKLFYEALVHAGAESELEPLLLRMLNLPLHPGEQSQLMTLLGQRYYLEGRYHDAVGCYRAGLELTPGNQTQMFNIGTALEQLGRYTEAVDFYTRVLAIEPENPGIHNNLALVMLRLGQYEHGWRHYEWRWKGSLNGQEQIFNIPRWQGEPLNGKSLLVWGEQGIGDHVMFSTMLPELQALGGTLHYEIYARLDPLFKRAFPDVNFLRRESAGEMAQDGVQVYRKSWPRADYQIPMGSLGTIFRNQATSFGDGCAYLKPNDEEVMELRQTYRELFPGKRLIGLSWRGGKALHTERQSRRVGYTDLARLRALDNVQFIDLQYDSSPEDRAELRALGLDLHHDDSVDPTAMMDRPAAQLCALDAVISVDNSTLHLAGALGVPSYALIQLNPNWRWGLNEGKSLWYNSVKLFRNASISEWKDVLDRVAKALKDDGII